MVLCQYMQLKKKKKRKSKSTNFHVNIDHKLSIRDILQRFFHAILKPISLLMSKLSIEDETKTQRTKTNLHYNRLM